MKSKKAKDRAGSKKKKKKVRKKARSSAPKDKVQKNEKIFLAKMIENIFPQMAQQILDRANFIRQQIRRRGSKHEK